MALMEISVIPLGTNGPSVSRYVARALRILKEASSVEYELTAMGTIIEGDLDTLIELAKKMHKATFGKNVKRVVTTIKIDDRRDKKITMEGKIISLCKKI
ncbi:MAG: MTH1187 family thiamine-binding protein [bacterium]